MIHVVILKKDTFQVVENDLDSPVGGIPYLGIITTLDGTDIKKEG